MLALPTTTKYPWWHHGQKFKAPPATSEEQSCFLNTLLVSKAQRDHNIKSSIFVASSQLAADLVSTVTKMLTWLWLRLPYYTTTWAKLNATFLCVTLNRTEMTSYPSCLRLSSQLFVRSKSQFFSFQAATKPESQICGWSFPVVFSSLPFQVNISLWTN